MSWRCRECLVSYLCSLWMVALVGYVAYMHTHLSLWMGAVGYALPSIGMMVAGWFSTVGMAPLNRLVFVTYGFFYISDSCVACIESVRYDIPDWYRTPKPRHKNFRY